MLKIQSVSKSFKSNKVLSDINMNVDTSDLIHIKGINGSGKSTLLKLIAGLLKPDDGNIKVDDNIKIGALIENPNFIESEALQFNLKFLYSLINNYNEIALQNIKKLTSIFSLDLDSKVNMKKYSLGMRQKAGIIQAIMEDQNLILLDEPTRGLDKNSITVFNEIINDLIKEGKSIIICAHDGVENLNFTKTYELTDGKII